MIENEKARSTRALSCLYLLRISPYLRVSGANDYPFDYRGGAKVTLAIDLASMANLYDQDEEPLIMHFVDDPVVADT